MTQTDRISEPVSVQAVETEAGWECSFADVFIGSVWKHTTGMFMAKGPGAFDEERACVTLREACIFLVVNFYPFMEPVE